jgi:glycerophosphoryl diester phosphodiesterase
VFASFRGDDQVISRREDLVNRIAMIGGGAVLAAALAFAGSAQAAPQAAGKPAHAVLLGQRGSPGQAPEETPAS